VSGATALVGAYAHEVDGNGNQGAAYVFNSSTAIPASQTIDFGPLSNLGVALGSPPFVIGAIATSSLPVSFTALNQNVRPGVVCRVSGDMVTLLAVGWSRRDLPINHKGGIARCHVSEAWVYEIYTPYN